LSRPFAHAFRRVIICSQFALMPEPGDHLQFVGFLESGGHLHTAESALEADR
jgi:hypothetical protein